MSYPHIRRFVDKMRGADPRHSRELVLSMSDAQGLHADITKLLCEVKELAELAATEKSQDNATINVELTGGAF